MAPKTPPPIRWDYDSLAAAAGVIRKTARDVQITVEGGELSWRDPSVKQTSSGGAVVQFAPIDKPQEWEQWEGRFVGAAIHNLMPVVTKALANLGDQADYAAEGLIRMANRQEATDTDLISIFDTMEKSFDHPRRDPS
jgi:hypothetical protein